MPNPDVPNLPSRVDQPTSTLFPSLGGGAPADHGAVEGQDITGQWLPSLSADNDLPPSNARGGSVIPSEGAPAMIDPVPAPTHREASVILDEPPAARRPRTVQDRINRLVKQWRQAEEQKSDLERNLELVARRLQEQDALIKEIANNRQPSLSAYNPPMPLDPLASINPANVPAAPLADRPLTAQSIKEIISGELNSFVARTSEQTRQVQQLQAAHQESFQEAVEEFPELADQRSSARQLFDRLYTSSPLRALPNAPYQIALQVQGLLVGESRQAAPGLSVEDRKRAASVPSTRTTPQVIPEAQRGAYQKEFDRVGSLIKAGDSSFETYRQWRQIRDGLRPAQ